MISLYTYKSNYIIYNNFIEYNLEKHFLFNYSLSLNKHVIIIIIAILNTISFRSSFNFVLV